MCEQLVIMIIKGDYNYFNYILKTSYYAKVSNNVSYKYLAKQKTLFCSVGSRYTK